MISRVIKRQDRASVLATQKDVLEWVLSPGEERELAKLELEKEASKKEKRIQDRLLKKARDYETHRKKTRKINVGMYCK